MSLAAGTRLGPYEVTAAIGAGGMGEVYRAKDTRLDRIVAIKVLPAHVADDPDLRQRFEREAKTISSLNHPHICTLYDVGEADLAGAESPAPSAQRVQFLVMECLEGETLAQRLTRGPLPLDQALRYATEIADALDKARRQGITHRDLKPANIMLTKVGSKLLDFGLAKLKQPGAGGAGVSALPTQQASLTQQGAILGTFQYMAPEQLEGKEADARTDLFAFGAVLYEMVTGRKAFEGQSQASLIHAIMGVDPPPMSSLQPMSPSAVDHLVKTCLAKDPDDRWQTAGDLARQLQWVSASVVTPQTAVSAPATGVTPARAGRVMSLRGAVGLTAVVAAATATGVWIATRPGPPPPAALQRLSINLPSTAPFLGANRDATMALSPDGAHLVYMAAGDNQSQLYMRALDQLEARPIPGAESSWSPFFSPDGEWIAFFTDGGTPQGKLKRVSVRGGPPLTLCDAVIPSGSWGPDDTIIFTHVTPDDSRWSLYRVPAAGGTPERLTTPEEDEHHAWPDVLPDGRTVLFSVAAGPSTGPGFDDDGRIAIVSLETGESRTVIEQGYRARYVPTGHVVYVLQGTLMAVPFALDRLEVTGSPVPMLEGFQTRPTTGVAGFAVSPTGLLVYAPGSAGAGAPEGIVVRMTRDGEEIESLVDQPLEYPRYLRVSPEGRRLALTTGTPNEGDLWVYDLDGRPPIPLTFEGHNLYPIWTPDGTRVAFQSTRAGDRDLFWMPADGRTLEAEPLLEGDNNQYPHAWSPDGLELLYREISPETGSDVWALRVDGDREPRVIVQTEYSETWPAISSDGRWLAYTSNVTGQSEIWVRPYADQGAPVRISPGGGREATWGPGDREIYYLEQDRLMAVEVETQPEFRFEPPRMLFDGIVPLAPNSAGFYDVAPDGTFVVVKAVSGQTTEEGDDPRDLVAVVNWFEELKQRAATN